VAQCKFPPLGRRSAGVLPHLGFEGTARGKNAEALNVETLCIIMLESRQGIEHAADIASVPGVDVLLVGTNDLSAELGVTGRPGDPKLEEAYRAVIEACHKNGMHAGMTGLHEAEIVTKLIGLGIRFVLGGTDLSFLMASARERTKFLRSVVPGR
jgi:4-hydroxy-2-oxoheptanedioate aldolase